MDRSAFKPGAAFVDATFGRLRVAAVRGDEAVVVSGASERRISLRALETRAAAGALVRDEIVPLRESLPQELRFDEDRGAVTVREIAAKWGVDKEQVFNILRRDGIEVLNVSSGAGARRHNRVPVGDYYRETRARLDLFDEERRYDGRGA